jgi:hypothetical protein
MGVMRILLQRRPPQRLRSFGGCSTDEHVELAIAVDAWMMHQ